MKRQKTEWILRILIVITIIFQTSGLVLAKGPGYLPPAAAERDNGWIAPIPDSFFPERVPDQPPLELPDTVTAFSQLIPTGFSRVEAVTLTDSAAALSVETGDGNITRFGVETAVAGRAGTALTFFDEQLLLIVPPESFAEDVLITLTPLVAPPAPIATDTAVIGEKAQVDGIGVPGNRRELLRLQLQIVTTAERERVSRFAIPLILAFDARAYDSGGLRWSIEQMIDGNGHDWETAHINEHHPQGIISTRVEQPAIVGVVGSGSAASWRSSWVPPSAVAFSGAATYQHDIPLPPGRGGLSPNLRISYNSRTLDSLILSPTDQGPLGLGFSFNQIAVHRMQSDISVQGGGYRVSLQDKFGLEFQDGFYELQLIAIEGNTARYLAVNAPWLRIRQIYDPGHTRGNQDHLYWLVEGPDGTRYRIGYTAAATRGQTVSGTAASFSESGTQLRGEPHWGALTWYVDTVTDVHGNQIQYDYFAAPNIVNEYYGSYMITEVRRPLEIRYNYKERARGDGRLPGQFPDAYASRIQFELAPGMNHRVDAIALYHLDYVNQNKPYQRFDIGLARYNAPFLCGQTGIYTEQIRFIEQQGYDENGQFFRLPRINLAYEDYGHAHIHDIDGDGQEESERCYRYAYLSSVTNSQGGKVSFVYAGDGRLSHSAWCNCIPAFGFSYFVIETIREDGVNPPSRTVFDRSQPCYDAVEGAVGDLPSDIPYCPRRISAEDYQSGSLVGFAQVTVHTYQYADNGPGELINSRKAGYHLGAFLQGKPRWQETWSARGALLERETFHYQRDRDDSNNDQTIDFDFSYLARGCTQTFVNGVQPPEQCTAYEYQRQINHQFGNLTHIRETGIVAGQGRIQKLTVHEYSVNRDRWIVNKMARETIFSAPSGTEIDPLMDIPRSDIRYYYDNNSSFRFAPIVGNLTAVEQLQENQPHPLPPPPTDLIAGVIYGFTEAWHPLPDTDVLLLNQAGEIAATTQANDDGIYYFHHLPAEQYSVAVCDYQEENGTWLAGYRPAVIPPHYGANVYTSRQSSRPSFCPAERPAPLPTATATAVPPTPSETPPAASPTPPPSPTPSATLPAPSPTPSKLRPVPILPPSPRAAAPMKDRPVMRYAVQSIALRYETIQTASFDSFGNQITLRDANNQPAFTEFDQTYHLYPIRTENALGHQHQFQYAGLNGPLSAGPPGTLHKEINPNGSPTLYFYDPFGRLTRQFDGWEEQCRGCTPGDDAAIGIRPSKSIHYADDAVPFRIDTWTKTQNDAVHWFGGGILERQFYDGFGNLIQTRKPHQDWFRSPQTGLITGQEQLTDLFYSPTGELIRQSQPYLVPAVNRSGNLYRSPDGGQPAQQLELDDLQRPLRTRHWNGAVTTTLYGDHAVYTEDGNGRLHTTYLDQFGNVSAIDDQLVTYEERFGTAALEGWHVSGMYGRSPAGVTLIADDRSSMIWRQTGGTAVAGTMLSFVTHAASPRGEIYLDYHTSGTDQYRRLGIIFGDFDGGGEIDINLQQVLGDNRGEMTPLLSLKPHTRYRLLLRSGGSDEQLLLLWEQDDPDQLAEVRLPHTDVGNEPARFVASITNGTLTLVDYQELEFHRTRYEYDIFGRLLKVTDPRENITRVTYDAAGRKRWMLDPDMGEWHYSYDNAGNLITQINPQNEEIRFTYDKLHRIVAKRLGPRSGDRLLATYTYDETGPDNAGLGFRTGMATYDAYASIRSSASWTYDGRGQLLQEKRQVFDQTYLFSFSYTQGGLPLTITYPGGAAGERGETVTTGYWWHTGRPRSLVGDGVYVQEAGYEHPAGLPTRLQLANGMTTNLEYDAAFRLQRQHTASEAQADNILDFSYSYDVLGNLLTITDSALPGFGDSQTQHFSYDSMNRLVTAVTTGQNTGNFQEQIEYDPLGNIIRKNGAELGYLHAAAGEYANAAPHAVTHINGRQRFWYDASGQMVRRIDDQQRDWQYSWTAENKLARAWNDDGDDLQFLYDGDGQLIMRLDGLGTAVEKSSILLGKLLEHDSVTGFRKQYLFNGQLLAVREGLQPDSAVNFLLRDHLGSVNVTLWANGSERANKRYTPWGEERWSVDVTPTRARFTAQRWDAGLGLLDYNARYYDPAIGRFISADIIVPGMEQTALAVDFQPEGLRQAARSDNAGSGPLYSQSLNRYSYGGNAPHNYIDPSGHSEILFEGEVTAAAAEELLLGLDEGIEILEEVLHQWGPDFFSAAMQDLFKAIGAAAGVALLSELGSPLQIASAAAQLIRSISFAELAGTITGWLTATTGQTSAGTLAAGLTGAVLVYAAIVTATLGAAAYWLVKSSIKQSLTDFRSLRSDLNSVIDTAKASESMIQIAMQTGRRGSHKVTFTTSNINGRLIEKSTILGRTPLQLFGISTKDALMATWPSTMHSRLSN